jgi:hypothetical protein
MPKLALTTHVHDPETGRTVVLNRGTDVQGRLLLLISNPGVWADPEEADRARSEFENAQASDGEEPVEALVEPPRSGAGSGRDAWVSFAAQQGVDVGDDDTRDDIIAAVDAEKNE